MPLRQFIQLAYTLPADPVVGGPGGVDSTRFDVEARAEGKASQQQRLEMRIRRKRQAIYPTCSRHLKISA